MRPPDLLTIKIESKDIVYVLFGLQVLVGLLEFFVPFFALIHVFLRTLYKEPGFKSG